MGNHVDTRGYKKKKNTETDFEKRKSKVGFKQHLRQIREQEQEYADNFDDEYETSIDHEDDAK